MQAVNIQHSLCQEVECFSLYFDDSWGRVGRGLNDSLDSSKVVAHECCANGYVWLDSQNRRPRLVNYETALDYVTLLELHDLV